MIFSAPLNNIIRPARNNESLYDYLKISGRPEAARVRKLMNDWYDQYDPSEKESLLWRLTSSKDNDFLSAFFELYLYTTYRKLGCTITLHPELPNGKRPDFLVRTSNGLEFYLEATLGNESSQSKSEKYLIHKLYDELNEKKYPNILLYLFSQGAPQKTPRYSIIIKKIEYWLDSIDPSEIKKIIEEDRCEELPKLEYSRDGWILEFWASHKESNESGRLIGLQSSDGLQNPEKQIRNSFKQKATRYSVLDKPYVIAINVMTNTFLESDILSSLYGTSDKSIIHMIDSSFGRLNRHACFCTPNGPVNTRVSAVMLFKSLDPWNIASRDQLIYINPFAKYKFDVTFFDSEFKNVLFINYSYKKSILLHGLIEKWPEKEPI